MKELLYHIVLLVVWTGVASAQAPRFVASTAVTSSTLLNLVLVDSDPADKHIYLYGSFEGTLYAQGDSLVSRGQSDCVIACFDETLRLLWWHTLGGPGADRVLDIKIIPNEGVVVAMSCGAGTATLTTYTIDDVTFSGRGNADVVTSLFNRDGEMVWVRNDGAESYEFPSCIHRFTDGTLAVIGSFGSHSRFGTTEIECGSGVAGGFVQMLSAGGEHLSVTHTVSVPDAGGIEDSDGSVMFSTITALSDSAFGIDVQGIGTNRIGDDVFTLGDLGDEGRGLLILDRSGSKSDFFKLYPCSTPWGFFEAVGSADGISGVDRNCVSSRNFFIVWHDSPYGRQDTILQTAFRNTEHARKARILSTNRIGARSLVFGAFVDTLDLPQTPKYPDAIAGSDTALPQAFVLIGDALGEFRRVLHIPSSLQGEASSACYTAEGMAVVMSTAGMITLPDTTLPGTADGVVLMAFGEPLTGIGEWGIGNGEWEKGNGEWEIGNGEWGMVSDITGVALYTGSVTREILGALVPGVYVIQSGGRLSLCHVLSADNIAFAVSAAASRKGP